MIQKKMLKKLCLAVAATALLTVFFACNKPRWVDNTIEDETNLHIMALERGYGTNWLKSLSAEFERKNEGVKVHISETVRSEALTNSLESGEKLNDVDIYFEVMTSSLHGKAAAYKNRFQGYEDGLYDLSEIYKSEIPGEDAAFGDKMFATVRESLKDDAGKIYGIPWAVGVMGINYNADVLRDALGGSYTLPNTTNELSNFAAAVKSSGKTPFVYPGQLDQWTYMLYPWWAQYEGTAEFDRFFEGKVYDDLSGKYIYSKDIFEQQGRLEALTVLEGLLDARKEWHPKNVNDYGGQNFRTIQAQFMVKSQGYAMYPCGDWLAQESANALDSEIRMMKTPVISSMIWRLDSVSNDAQLSKIVDYADGRITKGELLSAYSGISDKDINEVVSARNMVYSLAGQHIAYMPAYCNAKNLAQKFFLFMASDEGLKIYKNAVKGGFLPFSCDYAELPIYDNSVAELLKTPHMIVESSRSPLFYKGNVNAFRLALGTVDSLLGAEQGSKNLQTAQEVFDACKYTESAWQQVMRNSGL